MADKKITALQLRSDVDDDVNFPVDDGIQTYRATAPQVKSYVLSNDAIELRMLKDETASIKDVKNLTVVTSVASNILTIAIKTLAGTNPSSTDVVKIPFRNATAGTGNYNVRSISGALSMVVSSGATLGHLDAKACYLYLCAMDNAGTVELAVIGSRYDIDEGSVISTTAMSSAADDWNTYYSTTARSNLPMRVLARIKSTQTTAGTWASNASEISLGSIYDWPDGSSTKSDLTFTTAHFGSISNSGNFYNRYKDKMKVSGQFSETTGDAGDRAIILPSGLNIDTSKIGSSADGQMVGTLIRRVSGQTNNLYSVVNTAWILFYDGSTADRIFVSIKDGFAKSQGNDGAFDSQHVSFEFEIPIAEWRSY